MTFDHADWEDTWPILALIAAAIALLILIGRLAINDQARWNRFAASHACHVVERMSGDAATTVAPIVGGNGGVAVGIAVTPDKTAYLCDDGIKYWR
ncbi:MAG TPA: hypothetical protein VNH83_16600 [Bryobacteraceae bacterium]|nr:hypothetical protein [Bryobacteraceae bacterium]